MGGDPDVKNILQEASSGNENECILFQATAHAFQSTANKAGKREVTLQKRISVPSGLLRVNLPLKVGQQKTF